MKSIRAMRSDEEVAEFLPAASETDVCSRLRKSMEIRIFKVGKEKPEEMEIRCHEVTEEIREIVAFVKTRQGQITGLLEGEQYEIPVTDVCYIEAVDNKVFLYTSKKVYETRQKLYELEELLKEKHFLRVSKSLVLNLMKVQSIKPALNGRMRAVLRSGEEIMITRNYVVELKKALRGGRA
ncbi:MAG: LytTR family transcriptional regulator DNA-binding domain-containing protein [Lachnospiraceae bacterium]|nr:LytTR family transcriptional regulator DNA-binding domain-containing protein [Lachnospiraceae bacterium]